MSDTFGARLHRLREERGLRLCDLGKPSTIAQYEAGTRRPRQFSVILHLARILDVPPEVLADPLGIHAVTLTPQMRTVMDLVTTDPATATRLATDYMHAAEARGATSEIWGWGYVVSRLGRCAPSPLPLNAEGRLDIEQAISLAAQWIDRDRWLLAASLLESLSAICPPSSPFYGRLAHNAALAYSLLGCVSEALRWTDRALAWGASREDGWWQVMEAGVVSALLCDVPGYDTRLDAALAVLDAWRPQGAPEPLILSWAGTARATRAIRTGHVAEARRLVRFLLELLDAEPEVQPDLASIADVHARVVSRDQGPLAGLVVLEPMMAVAEHRGDPGYVLLSAQLTAVELAIKAQRPGAERQLLWLVGYLGGVGADRQVARLQARLETTPVHLAGLTLNTLSPRLLREEGS